MMTLKSTVTLAAAALLLLAVDASSLSIQARQIATAGNNTDIKSISNGGAGSAQVSAQAAGSSISTGTGGLRSTPSSPKEFAQLLSGIFFGSLLTLFAGGALAVQVWHYYEAFGRKGGDKLRLQIVVGILLLFSILQDCALVHRIYAIHVLHFGDFAFPLLTVGWEVACSFVCISIMNGLVQMYYAHRVWVAYHKSQYFFVFYAFLIAFSFAGGIASAALIIQSGSAANVKGEALRSFMPDSIPWQFSVVFASWLCSSCFIDVSLCTSLIYQLGKMSTPFFHTRHAVALMLSLSLETCAATSALSFVSMVLFLTIPYQSYYNITFLPIGQIAASSLLVTIMARSSLARELAQDQTLQPPGPDFEDSAPPPSPTILTRPIVKRWMEREDKKRKRGDRTGVHLTTIIQQDGSISEDPHEQGAPWSQGRRSDSPTDGMPMNGSPTTGILIDAERSSSGTISSAGSTTLGPSTRQLPVHPSSLLSEKTSQSDDQVHPSSALYLGRAIENGSPAGSVHERADLIFGRTPRGRIVSILPPPPLPLAKSDYSACPWADPGTEEPSLD